jgi:hypothetical protein
VVDAVELGIVARVRQRRERSHQRLRNLVLPQVLLEERSLCAGPKFKTLQSLNLPHVLRCPLKGDEFVCELNMCQDFSNSTFYFDHSAVAQEYP